MTLFDRPALRCATLLLMLALLLPLAAPMARIGAACCQVGSGRCCCPKPPEGQCFMAMPCGSQGNSEAPPAPALLGLAVMPRTHIAWPRVAADRITMARAAILSQADITPPDPPPRLLLI